MKLTEVIDQYLIDCEGRQTGGTLGNKRRQLGLMARWLEEKGVHDLESVNIVLLRQFLHFLQHSENTERFAHSTRKGKLTPSSVALYVANVKAFFQWCVMEEILDKSPAMRLQKPKVPARVITSLTNEQVECLLGACDTETRSGFRDYVMLLLLLDTGIRVSELCNLKLANVYQKHIKIMGKGQKEREVGIHPEVSKLLWKYIQKHRGAFMIESDYVFVGERGPIGIRAVEGTITKLKEQCGITDMRVSPHVFRHTHAKQYLKEGGDLFKLSRELGHSSIQVTGNIYLGDFKSSDAIQDHALHSPINGMKLARQKDDKKVKRGKKKS